MTVTHVQGVQQKDISEQFGQGTLRALQFRLSDFEV